MQQCGNGIALCTQKNEGGEVKIKVRKGQDLFLVKDRDKQPVHKALFLCIKPKRAIGGLISVGVFEKSLWTVEKVFVAG